ncbi:hypothetical protein CHISP_3066 [Chitinispirillum alkaliphilum]|nr:hypothetical protein CHISP_3066 [Chitinispirillum alkaliphilum]
MLTALKIGPNMVLTDDYLPYILKKSDETPVLESTSEIEKVKTLIAEMEEEIITQIDSQTFEPLLDTPFSEHDNSGVKKWCSGFSRGMVFWGEELLYQFNEDAELVVLLTPIIHFFDDCEYPDRSKDAGDENDCEMYSYIGKAIPLIHKFWSEYIKYECNNDIPNATAPFVKIGRNEMCPCESGKKYKKCCGNN